MAPIHPPVPVDPGKAKKALKAALLMAKVVAQSPPVPPTFKAILKFISTNEVQVSLSDISSVEKE